MKKTITAFVFVCFTIILLYTFCPVSVCAEGNQTMKKEYRETQKIVSVVYDDSGSMSENGIDSWSEVSYSMQLFSGMLSNRDKLYISYMSDKIIARPIELTDDRQSIADEIREHFEESSTPLATVETAYQALITAPAQNEEAEYWLVIFTDGGFQVSDGAGEAYARQKFNELIDQYSQTLMPNGTRLNIVYLAMGEHAYELKDTEAENITAFQCDENKIVETMAEISYLVMNKYHFENNSGFINFASENVIELTTPLPLFDLTVIAQNKNVRVSKISNVDTGEELSLYAYVNAKYPVQSGHNSNTSLIGTLANGNYQDKFMPAGTYRIEFDSPYDQSGISVFGSLAVEIRITNTYQNTTDVIDNLSDVYDYVVIDSTAVAYIFQTDQVADLTLLHEELQYNFGYSVNNELQKSVQDKDMRLTSLQLKGEPSALESKIVLGNSGYLRTTLTYQPQKFYVYRISAIGNGMLTVSRNKLNRNSKSVRFCVYKNGGRITDANELMKLRIDFSLKNKGSFTYVDAQYTRDGYIICTPKFSSGHTVFGTLTNWLSSYVCPVGENAVFGTFHTVYSHDDVAAAADFNIKRENLPVYIFHLSIPLFVLLIAVGYVLKPRFKKNAKIQRIFFKNENGLLRSHMYIRQEIELQAAVNIRSFIPFVANRATVDSITLKAIGSIFSKQPYIGIARKHLPEDSSLIHVSGDISTHGGIVFNSENTTVKNISSIKGKLKISCNQGLLVPEDTDLWIVYMTTHYKKQK